MATLRSAENVATRLEALVSPRTRQALGILTFTVLTALSARIALPIAGTQVPFTFQPLAVMLAGALLGARLGAASQILYLAAGLSGLPVFALGSILAPSGGYLMAYPFAAFAVGALTGGPALRKLLGFIAGLAVIYAGGVAWLALTIGWRNAVLAGVVPFIAADLVKVGLALVVSLRLQERTRSFFAA